MSLANKIEEEYDENLISYRRSNEFLSLSDAIDQLFDDLVTQAPEHADSLKKLRSLMLFREDALSRKAYSIGYMNGMTDRKEFFEFH